MRTIARTAALFLAASVWGSAPAQAPGRTVRDMTDREVRLSDGPSRIVSLCLPATDTLLRLGRAGRLVGVDEHGVRIPGAERLPVVARGGTVSIERIVAAGADLAFVWWYQEEAARVLEAHRVPVVRLRSPRAADVPAMIRLVGDCAGEQAAAAALARPVEAFLAASVAATPATHAPAVFLELYGPFKTAGRGTFLDDLIALAGGRNLAAASEGHVIFSAEAVAAADPCVVLLAGAPPEDFVRRPGMAGTAAARAGRVWALDRALTVAGAGLPESVARLRDLLRRSGRPEGAARAVP